MNVLVANLGSTSFKYRLFAFSEAGSVRELASGGYDRVTDYGDAIEQALERLLSEGILHRASEVDAVGFKAVLARNLTGCVEVDDSVLEAMESIRAVAPAHNPAYVAGMKAFAEKIPHARRVALFETSFYQWMPEAAKRFAVPESWHSAGIRRYGFHGASHKFIGERTAELCGREDVAARLRDLYVEGPGEFTGKRFRVISCHLGGSSSVTGIDTGVAIGNSLGFSPQSGLPHNNRVGDLDSMAVPFAMKTLGLSIDEVERQLSKEGGLLGISGVSNDLRDVHDAAEGGNRRAQRAIDYLVHQTRHWVGAYFFQMGGAEAIVFTGGIGENNPWFRTAVCAGLESFGIRLDESQNAEADGEATISPDDAPVRVMVVPTNEELVVARETHRFLARSAAAV